MDLRAHISSTAQGHLQKKLEEQECRVFIAYPATLKYSDSKGKVITVRNEELKKMESEMEK